MCREVLGGSSHYHCGNCGKETGMMGHLIVRDGNSTFTCTRPEWWQKWLDDYPEWTDEDNEEDSMSKRNQPVKEAETVLEESNGQPSSTTLVKEESARMSRDAAMKAIEEERRERTTACGEDVNKVLQKHRCSLVAHVEIVGQQVRSTVVIAAND